MLKTLVELDVTGAEVGAAVAAGLVRVAEFSPDRRHDVIKLFYQLCQQKWDMAGVTRSGDLLDFGQPFKAFGNN